jgi:pimeloyl-ACP methyl ester carboxylesterase
MDRASRNAVLLVLGLAYGTLSLLPMIGAVILLPTAETWRGRIFAVAAFCLLALPPVAVRARVNTTRTSVLLAGAVGTLLGVLLVVLYVASPDGRPLPGSPLRSEFLANNRYRRFAVAALLPEIDQIKLGTYVAPALDPIIDRPQARRIRAMTMRHYRAMETDPEFAALGTVLPDAYADRDNGHVFAYAPPHEAGERLPTILFLHGSAGNFKAYFYLWKRFADRMRMIVVCPSFGFGNWDEQHGVEAVERARAWAVATLGVDETRIYLVGLSNGGTGVTRAAAATPGAYRGLVFLSGVLEDEILRSAAKPGEARFPLPWPMLIIHGRDDDRVPLSDVEGSLARLRKRGATVEEHIFEREDHFLFFDRDDEVLTMVEQWVRGLEHQ